MELAESLQSYAKKRMAPYERIRALEERVTRLEEEVRILTSMMRGAGPTVPITPWKSPFVYGPLPAINIDDSVQTPGTFRDGINQDITCGYPKTTGG